MTKKENKSGMKQIDDVLMGMSNLHGLPLHVLIKLEPDRKYKRVLIKILAVARDQDDLKWIQEEMRADKIAYLG